MSLREDLDKRLSVEAFENVLYGKKTRPDGSKVYHHDSFATGMKVRKTTDSTSGVCTQKMNSYHLRKRAINSLLVKRIVCADRVHTIPYGLTDSNPELEMLCAQSDH